jgi:hypothetical protein
MYTIIRVDGREERHHERPTLPLILAAIGATSLDAVNLGPHNDPPDDEIMCVDDTGMLDGKPINPKATARYHAICEPGNPYSIHGDVVLTYDRFFG